MCTFIYSELHNARETEVEIRVHREVWPGEIRSAGLSMRSAGNMKAEKKLILLTLSSRLSISGTSDSCCRLE